MRVYQVLEHHFKEIENPDLPALLTQPDRLIWVEMIGPTFEEIQVMSDVFHFHPLAIEDTTNQRQRPKVDEYDSYTFSILNPIQVEKDEVTFRELDLFIGSNYLVTVHKTSEAVVQRVLEQCVIRSKHNVPFSIGYIVYVLADVIVDQYLEVVDKMADEIDMLGETVFEMPKREYLTRIFALKRALAEIWRVAGGQRDIFALLTRKDSEIIKEASLRYYVRDVYDHLLRIIDTVHSLRDGLGSVMDLYLSASSSRLNITVKRLTVMTIGFGALAVITGFYGMNFERTFPPFTSPWGVPFVLLLMALVIGVIVLYIRQED